MSFNNSSLISHQNHALRLYAGASSRISTPNDILPNGIYGNEVVKRACAFFGILKNELCLSPKLAKDKFYIVVINQPSSPPSSPISPISSSPSSSPILSSTHTTPLFSSTPTPKVSPIKKTTSPKPTPYSKRPQRFSSQPQVILNDDDIIFDEYANYIMSKITTATEHLINARKKAKGRKETVRITFDMIYLCNDQRIYNNFIQIGRYYIKENEMIEKPRYVTAMKKFHALHKSDFLFLANLEVKDEAGLKIFVIDTEKTMAEIEYEKRLERQLQMKNKFRIDRDF